jgi:hypothetical protein
LAERAIGFWETWDEETIDHKSRKTITRHKRCFPPDVTAGIYWSKNRMRDKWSDVHKHEVKTQQLKSSAELLEDMRKQILDLQAEGYLEGVVVHPRPLQHAGRYAPDQLAITAIEDKTTTDPPGPHTCVVRPSKTTKPRQK